MFVPDFVCGLQPKWMNWNPCPLMKFKMDFLLKPWFIYLEGFQWAFSNGCCDRYLFPCVWVILFCNYFVLICSFIKLKTNLLRKYLGFQSLITDARTAAFKQTILNKSIISRQILFFSAHKWNLTVISFPRYIFDDFKVSEWAFGTCRVFFRSAVYFFPL